jgi:hypothetical protein
VLWIRNRIQLEASIAKSGPEVGKLLWIHNNDFNCTIRKLKIGLSEKNGRTMNTNTHPTHNYCIGIRP